MTLENALRKARAVSVAGTAEMVLGCDTIVALDGRIYGKPATSARRPTRLSSPGRPHHAVVSGLAVLARRQERPAVAVDRGHVQHARATEQSTAYVDDGRVARALRRLRDPGRRRRSWSSGSRAKYENVVGLPLGPLLELCPELRARGLRPRYGNSRSQPPCVVGGEGVR